MLLSFLVSKRSLHIVDKIVLNYPVIEVDKEKGIETLDLLSDPEYAQEQAKL